MKHLILEKVFKFKKKFNVNSFDADFRTPLHLAAAGGHSLIVKFLLDQGAILSQDSFGNIPIHDAKRIKNREI